MSEPTPAPTPSPTPSPEPTPSPSPSPAAERPAWLPENHWDAEKSTIKDDFGAHYAELQNFHKSETERQAALKARKPEDIKFDPAALPQDISEEAKKLGLKVTIDEKDPRIPAIRQIAVEAGLDQDVVNKLVAMDAKLKLQQTSAEIARITEEDKKLGANKDTRKQAIATWIDGLKAAKTLSEEEAQELRLTAVTAAGVTALEKIIAKAAGTIPGNQPPAPPPPPAPKSLAERLYPNLPSTRTA